MVIHDSRNYRIEEFTGYPCRFAVDYKERSERGVCLVNIGWAQERGAAYRLMNDHALSLSIS
jgi:hypothetical protein